MKYQRIPALNEATTITDNDKLIVETNAASDATKRVSANKFKVYIPIKNHLGEVISSALPINDDSLHLLDGSQLNNTNYPAFLSHMASLYNASASANYFFHPYQGTKNRFTKYGNPTISGNELIFDNDNSAEKQYIVSDVPSSNPKDTWKTTFYFPLFFDVGSLSKKRIVATYAEPDDISTRRLELGIGTDGYFFVRYYNTDGVTLISEYNTFSYSGSAPIGEGYYITNLGWYFFYYLDYIDVYFWNGTKGQIRYPWGRDSSKLNIGAHHLILGNTPFQSDCYGFQGKFNLNDGYFFDTDYSQGELPHTWDARGTGTITNEEQWAEVNETYGVVGKYAYTSANNTIRIPKLNCITDYANTDTVLGNISSINYTQGTEKLTTLTQYNYVVVK